MKQHLIVFVFVLCLSLTLANDAAEEFTAGNHLFTSSVYKEIAKNSKSNFLVSPISAEIILALTQSGAVNETGEEIRTALHLPASQEKIETAVKSLQPALRQNELYTLQTANKIYLRQNSTINDGFLKIATDVFDSELERIVFIPAEEAAATMNGWVENQTEHKIKDLIASDTLSNATRAILINALYFKGNWSKPFEPFATHNQSFYKSEKEVVDVDTMRTIVFTNYYKDKELDARFLELPFEGEKVTMTIVLPNKKDGLQLLENQLEKLTTVPKYRKEEVAVALPKFKIESELDFKEILQNLGVKAIFDDDAADLSGIAGQKGDLVVDKVLQKTFIDVNEDGVEAAATSYVGVIDTRLSIEPSEEFIADHPFIFYLKVEDLIIFAGRVVDPRG